MSEGYKLLHILQASEASITLDWHHFLLAIQKQHTLIKYNEIEIKWTLQLSLGIFMMPFVFKKIVLFLKYLKLGRYSSVMALVERHGVNLQGVKAKAQ